MIQYLNKARAFHNGDLINSANPSHKRFICKFWNGLLSPKALLKGNEATSPHHTKQTTTKEASHYVIHSCVFNIMLENDI